MQYDAKELALNRVITVLDDDGDDDDNSNSEMQRPFEGQGLSTDFLGSSSI